VTKSAYERWTWQRCATQILSLKGRLGYEDELSILGFQIHEDGRIVDPFRDDFVVFDPAWRDPPAAVPVRYSAVCEMYCLLSIYSRTTVDRLLAGEWTSIGHVYPPSARELTASECRALFAYDRQRLAKLRRIASPFFGRNIDEGDLAFEVQPLPRVPIRLVLWQGDEETGDGGAVLVDRSAEVFVPNMVVELASLTVWRLRNILDPGVKWGYHALAAREVERRLR
jgi:hypothetical protein